MMPRVEQAFAQLVAGSSASQAPAAGDAASQAPALDLGCARCWQGLLADKAQLQGLVLAADQRYQQAYEQAGEIDERDLLTADLASLASPKAALPAAMAGLSKPPLVPSSGGAAAAATASAVLAGSAGRKLGLGLQSPLPLMQLGQAGLATPITTAMSAVAWLRQQTAGMSAEPSPALRAYFAAAGTEAGAVLTQRVQQAARSVFDVGAARPAAPVSLQGLPGLQEGYAAERREEVRAAGARQSIALACRSVPGSTCIPSMPPPPRGAQKATPKLRPDSRLPTPPRPPARLAPAGAEAVLAHAGVLPPPGGAQQRRGGRGHPGGPLVLPPVPAGLRL